MGYLSLEDIYPDDVEKYAHLRVDVTELYVKESHAIYGVVTRGEYRELTRMLLRDRIARGLRSVDEPAR